MYMYIYIWKKFNNKCVKKQHEDSAGETLYSSGMLGCITGPKGRYSCTVFFQRVASLRKLATFLPSESGQIHELGCLLSYFPFPETAWFYSFGRFGASSWLLSTSIPGKLTWNLKVNHVDPWRRRFLLLKS